MSTPIWRRLPLSQSGLFGRKKAESSVKAYIDWRDWWVGYYRGDDHHYVCLLPCIVIRWPRQGRRQR